GMGYGDHIDDCAMKGDPPGRTDLAMTLFLSDPDRYDGGELVIDSDADAQRIKLPRGSLVVYPGSTIHRVEPVTRGTRFAVACWIQSLVRDHQRRRLLVDLDELQRWADRLAPGAPEGLRLQKLRGTILR